MTDVGAGETIFAVDDALFFDGFCGTMTLLMSLWRDSSFTDIPRMYMSSIIKCSFIRFRMRDLMLRSVVFGTLSCFKSSCRGEGIFSRWVIKWTRSSERSFVFMWTKLFVMTSFGWEKTLTIFAMKFSNTVC